MDFWSVTWSDVTTVAGLIVSLLALLWAIKEAHGARTASEAAQAAVSETRDQIASHLQAADLQRAIGLIERIKTLQDNNRWEASREHYQTLRAMLSYVIARCPQSQSEIRDKLVSARAVIVSMERRARQRVDRGASDRERSRLNRSLTDIQTDLEELASNVELGNP